jgi:catechol 2,3-dioxygenase-like lactoylglutathione lyase family enzyme
LLCLLNAAFPLPDAMAAVNKVPAGSWGGRHVHLIVTDKDATIEFDCAHGVLAGPLVLSKSGTFEVPGTFVLERPGPRIDGQEPPARHATYSGRVRDKEMQITFRFDDTHEENDTFTLVLGEDPRLRKCR